MTVPSPGAREFTTPAEYPPRTVLFRQNETPSAAYLIVTGVVRLTSVSGDGVPMILGLRSGGSVVGASAIIADGRHSTTVSTVTDCRLQQVNASDLRSLMESDRNISRWIAAALANDVRQQIAWSQLASSRDSLVRLGILFSILKRVESSVRPDGSVRLPPLLNVSEVAQSIGRTRESVSRLFRDCHKRGVLRRDKGWYVIPVGSPILDLSPAVPE